MEGDPLCQTGAAKGFEEPFLTKLHTPTSSLPRSLAAGFAEGLSDSEVIVLEFTFAIQQKIIIF